MKKKISQLDDVLCDSENEGHELVIEAPVKTGEVNVSVLMPIKSRLGYFSFVGL